MSCPSWRAWGPPGLSQRPWVASSGTLTSRGTFCLEGQGIGRRHLRLRTMQGTVEGDVQHTVSCGCIVIGLWLEATTSSRSSWPCLDPVAMPVAVHCTSSPAQSKLGVGCCSTPKGPLSWGPRGAHRHSLPLLCPPLGAEISTGIGLKTWGNDGKTSGFSIRG